MAGNQPAPNGAPHTVAQGRDKWDFLIIAVVVAAIVGLTLGLVFRYPHTPGAVESILGIVVPAFAAIFGIAAGYAGGHVTGQARGMQIGKQEVREPLLRRINALSQQAGSIDTTLRTHAENPAGSDRWRLRTMVAAEPIDLGTTEDLDLASTINSLRDYVANM